MSRGDWFEYQFVANPKDSFSHVKVAIECATKADKQYWENNFG